MKQLLFIGHFFHAKTQSTAFLQDLLRTRYDVETAFVDAPRGADVPSLETLRGRRFDVLVVCQITPDFSKLRSLLTFDHGVFFPMYDACPSLWREEWKTLKDFKIINFSRALHERLSAFGFDSRYIQFFPKPRTGFSWGSPKSAYFWQRRMDINIRCVETLLAQTPLDALHIHDAPDPGNVSTPPSEAIRSKVKYSTWYDDAAMMERDIEQSALYIAPRLYEGIGMSFLNAMAMGRCVVAPDNPTMNEYIVHGETGYLYDPRNVQPLAMPSIASVQKNAYDYISRGYETWERKKYDILEWLEESVVQSVNIRHLRFRETYWLYCLGIAIVLRQYQEGEIRWKFRNAFTLAKVSIDPRGKKRVYLFSFLRVG